MPSWDELQNQFMGIHSKSPQETTQQKIKWVIAKIRKYMGVTSHLLGDRNIIFYGSAFLQKQVPSNNLSITFEDMNGFMTMLHGMDCQKGLTLILHTSGGSINAAESIVDYLHSKFDDFEVIIPTFAMSAGTMIALSSTKITMGRQSQLGPIDPQMPYNGKTISANAIINQFKKAKEEITEDIKNAHVWAPITSSLGPSLYQEASDALDYSERMVAKWLAKRMFAGHPNPVAKGKEVAKYFNGRAEGDQQHKSHGRRIGREQAISQDLNIEILEDTPKLQDSVLSLYHVLTILIETSPLTKIMIDQNGKKWLKNFVITQQIPNAATKQNPQNIQPPQHRVNHPPRQ